MMVHLSVSLIKWRTINMPEQKIDFEKEMNRLDQIVSDVSKESLPLDECLKLYQEGQSIVKKLEQALKEAEEKVAKIIKEQ